MVLPAPFGPLSRTTSPGIDLEVGAGERGKSSEHANGRPKAYAAQPELRGPGVRYGRKLTEAPVEPCEPGRPPRATGRDTAGTIGAVRRAIAGVGRTLVTLGLLILLFVVYQLWGTGIFTARAQENLKSKFEKQLAVSRRARQPGRSPPTTTTKPRAP